MCGYAAEILSQSIQINLFAIRRNANYGIPIALPIG